MSEDSDSDLTKPDGKNEYIHQTEAAAIDQPHRQTLSTPEGTETSGYERSNLTTPNIQSGDYHILQSSTADTVNLASSSSSHHYERISDTPHHFAERETHHTVTTAPNAISEERTTLYTSVVNMNIEPPAQERSITTQRYEVHSSGQLGGQHAVQESGSSSYNILGSGHQSEFHESARSGGLLERREYSSVSRREGASHSYGTLGRGVTVRASADQPAVILHTYDDLLTWERRQFSETNSHLDEFIAKVRELEEQNRLLVIALQDHKDRSTGVLSVKMKTVLEEISSVRPEFLAPAHAKNKKKVERNRLVVSVSAARHTFEVENEAAAHEQARNLDLRNAIRNSEVELNSLRATLAGLENERHRSLAEQTDLQRQLDEQYENMDQNYLKKFDLEDQIHILRNEMTLLKKVQSSEYVEVKKMIGTLPSDYDQKAFFRDALEQAKADLRREFDLLQTVIHAYRKTYYEILIRFEQALITEHSVNFTPELQRLGSQIDTMRIRIDEVNQLILRNERRHAEVRGQLDEVRRRPNPLDSVQLELRREFEAELRKRDYLYLSTESELAIYRALVNKVTGYAPIVIAEPVVVQENDYSAWGIEEERKEAVETHSNVTNYSTHHVLGSQTVDSGIGHGVESDYRTKWSARAPETNISTYQSYQIHNVTGNSNQGALTEQRQESGYHSLQTYEASSIKGLQKDTLSIIRPSTLESNYEILHGASSRATTPATPATGPIAIHFCDIEGRYVELINVSRSAQDLSGWVLKRDFVSFTIPEGTLLEKKRKLRIYAGYRDNDSGDCDVIVMAGIKSWGQSLNHTTLLSKNHEQRASYTSSYNEGYYFLH